MPISFGSLTISTVNFGFFRLDGGAMFGSVPKNLWAKRIPADEENCIRLATRCLLLKDSSTGRQLLVDVGNGDKWSDKQRQIFAIESSAPEALGIDPSAVTDIILTHLHFDHAGGISRYRDKHSKDLELVYPQARVFLQGENLENARGPSLKERASYLAENYEPLSQTEVILVDGDVEVYPGVVVHQVHGHTRGQQWIEVRGSGKVLFFPTDLIPTQHHLPVPFHMGYDACAETVLTEKSEFLRRAVSEQAIVVFEHDPDLAACTVKIDERGQYAVDRPIAID